MQMAVAVTGSGAVFERHGSLLASLQQRIVPAADADVQDFGAVISAVRLPRGDDRQQGARLQAIEAASIAATEGPLSLVAVFVEALALSHDVESVVKASVVSDVRAAREVIAGAARAAVLTADTNIDQLDRLRSPAGPELRARRDTLVTALEDAS